MNSKFFLITFILFLLSSTTQAAPTVVMDTNMGKVTIELHADKAPITVNNFLKYIEKKHYDNTIFHRVIGNFMIQGGGYEPGLTKLSTDLPIVNEASNGLKNKKGTIAMARLPQPHTATNQFFINLADNSFLDYPASGGGYAVFGTVVEGMSVVEKIGGLPTEAILQFRDFPTKKVIINSIRLKEDADKAAAEKEKATPANKQEPAKKAEAKTPAMKDNSSN